MTADRLPILERVFHRQCCSLAQYVGDSWPWTHSADLQAEELVRSIMADERRWAQQLAELIDARGGVPRPGSYPAEFTDHNLHYLALDFMLLKLAEWIQREVAALEPDRTAVADDPAIHCLLEQMIERKRGQVEALRRFAKATAPVSAVSSPSG
jgi:hypothetical protein